MSSASAIAQGSATRCSECGQPMVCGRNNPAGCWCAALPPLSASLIASGQSCVCEQCLRARHDGPGAAPDGQDRLQTRPG